ncbi:hypothetical protein CDAR_170101 [Caerostris darwini]|uniref:Uncharacterized protein n=1 Tax=Caerostris darwini TaxID=1538125 RepID=A0AAV4RTM5_9ARAC|nr:hypothetical protein CDAR_170101 [Caerostris darwini]
MFTTRFVWFLYFLPSACPINIIDVFLPGAPSTEVPLPALPGYHSHTKPCIDAHAQWNSFEKDPIFSSPIPFHYSDLFRKFESPTSKVYDEQVPSRIVSHLMNFRNTIVSF